MAPARAVLLVGIFAIQALVLDRAQLGKGDCQCAEGRFYPGCARHVVHSASAFCASIGPSRAWELLTRNEIQRESAAHHNRAAPAAAQPGAPIITVEAPEPTDSAAGNAAYYFQTPGR